MTLKQLRAKARSLMRTANRRIDTYRKEGVINLSLESIIDNLKSAGMFNDKTNRISMAGLDERGLKVLIGYQEDLKEVETVAKYKKKVVESYNENKEIIVSIFIFVVACAGMAIRVFISYPVQVGESRIYLESRKYKKTKRFAGS